MVGIVSSPVRAKRVFTQPRADQFFLSSLPGLDVDQVVASLKGKLAVVTGAASGTGYYVAEQLAVKFQMAVVLVDKDMAKLKEARELIQVAARDQFMKDDPKLYVVSYIADDLSLIKAAANDIRAIARSPQHKSRLQLLIHLAPMEPYAGLTPQGVEHNYSRNFLAPFCFTEHLIGLMKAASTDKTTPTPRCIFSTAPLAKMPPVNTSNLKGQVTIASDDDTALSYYAASQVFLSAVTQYMARRYGSCGMEIASIVTERGSSMMYSTNDSSSSLSRLYSYGSALLDYSPSQRAVPFLEAALGVERKSVLEMDLPGPIRVTDAVAKETYFAAKSLTGIRSKLMRSPSEQH
jgi:NAD(P)-dependent dehydrogenase (short-subunit alcohol dehydrogenase family)